MACNDAGCCFMCNVMYRPLLCHHWQAGRVGRYCGETHINGWLMLPIANFASAPVPRNISFAEVFLRCIFIILFICCVCVRMKMLYVSHRIVSIHLKSTEGLEQNQLAILMSMPHNVFVHSVRCMCV